MIYSAVDLCIEIDFGPDQPGAILQRKDKGHGHDYLIDGKPVTNPFDVESLPPVFNCTQNCPKFALKIAPLRCGSEKCCQTA